MNLFDALILGLVQGLTEFLPVSSSGHLVLAEHFLGLDVSKLQSFDIAVHFGTLLAIFVYFRRDFTALLKTFFGICIGRVRFGDASGGAGENVRMIQFLVVGTLPAVAVGLLFADFLEEHMRTPASVAVMFLMVAVYFVVAEFLGGWGKGRGRDGGGEKTKKKLGWKQVLLIGAAQGAALIPGISRSGSTIATGILTGMKREEAARFSFLLGAVAITAATTLSVYKVSKGEFFLPSFEIVAVGVVSSFGAGWAAVAFLMQLLKKHTLLSFAVYLAATGISVLFLL